MKKIIATAAVGAAVAGALITAPTASADYVMGCERVRWGFLFSGYRTICDGPKRPDGSWDRTRREWTPDHWAGGYCSGYYYISCTPRYFVPESTQRLETYPVTDATVLPGEPAWIPPGTVRII
ncbi:hypothetical protein PBI_OAKER_71 [Mycobacterium phage Oaker]|uniref:hypothetical protein n=1 Tax=Mycobacterium phage Oaker TaxID=1445727 RepID=UPI0003E3CDAD|nr:hypothetical protein CH12_gp71 [Mycobacterium phage Oaker]AHG24462.1 hypothetical protein PBI_OAKER_71 [Mycobacterium phage Oaker]AVO26049.1 hypothetical protein SEA_THUMB_72 [Mycobacterium phage Thumb]QDH84934.1 hypothetical protein SEA_Phreeze_70 [Mycobacterium phage Phreeze]QLF83955.1 hypothetical protein SEA_BECKERTON_70 [Mycobacterium phage Beckerton]